MAMTYDDDYITLKWGTLKSWRLTNPALDPLIEEYNKEGSSLSAMAQRDTQRQKEIICEMIEIIGKPVYLDWDGEYVSVEEAKKYVMEYGK
jgi:hypothetical protein